MNILELEKFKIEDAINFHDELNPLLFDEHNKLKPNIKSQLDTIVDDFIEYMGIPDLAVEDVIITGSNVAFTYTPHSDIDLHLLVDFSALPESDVYKELFNAKKSLYNDTYEITIRDIPVELYVQDTAQAHTSLGEYSLYQDKFTRIPRKTRANLDEISTEHKFERLEQLAIQGLKSEDIDKVNEVLSIIKRYRQAGLDNKGEFGPENLAFKAIRSKGYFQALFDLRNKLRGKQLSIEEEMLRRTFEESIGVYNSKVNIAEDMSKEDLADQWNVSTKEIAKAIDLGVKVEMRNNPQVTATTPQLRREQATKIVVNNLVHDVEYYPKMISFIRAVNQLNQTTSTNDGAGSDINDVSQMQDMGYKPSQVNEGQLSMLADDPNVDWEGVYDSDVMADLESMWNEDIEKRTNALKQKYPKLKDEDYWNLDDEDVLKISSDAPDDIDRRMNAGQPAYEVVDAWADKHGIPERVPSNQQTVGGLAIFNSFEELGYQNEYTPIAFYEAGGLDSVRKLNPQASSKTFVQDPKYINSDDPDQIDEASGYIPSEAQKNDPRFSYALTKDVRPDTMKKGAKAMGLGDISRAGVPPLLRPGKPEKKSKKSNKSDFGKGIY